MSILSQFEYAVEQLVPNTDNVLVGRQRKPRPYLNTTQEFGTDARSALEYLESIGGANFQRRITARKRGVDIEYSNFPTDHQQVFGPSGALTALWQEVRA